MPERQALVLSLHDAGRATRALMKRLALAVDARPLAASTHHRLRQRVLQRGAEERAPRGTQTRRAADDRWRPLAAGVDFRLLHADAARGTMTAFVRLRPGAVFAAHDHARTEQCLVLEGEIRIGTHPLRAGDLHVAAPGTRHEVTRSEHGALLWVHGAMPASVCAV